MFRPFTTFARYIKRLRADRQWEKRRHQSSYRAVALAVKLVITGALTPSTRCVTIVPLKRKGEFTC